MREKKRFRPNVAAVVLSPRYPLLCEVMIALRSDIDGAWQFPQGGIDRGETPKEALFRELKEEIGTDEVEIIAQYPGWLSYEFPGKIAKKMYPYDGQTQTYFLVRLKGGAKIKLDTHQPEFIDYTFVDAKDVLDKITHFKKSVYRKVLHYFKKEGYL